MQVYLDNAATTPIDPEVIEVMKPYFGELYGNPSSQHALGRKARVAIEQARKTIAEIIGANASEIIFTSGGTEAINIFLQGIAGLTKHIISSEIEHPAVLHTIKALAKANKISVSWVDLDKKGYVLLDSLEKEIIANPGALVALMHGNNEIGNLLPLNEAAALCQPYETLFFSDCVQTIGHLPIDVKNTPITGLAASAHKFHGPKGAGFLYLRGGTKINSVFKGGEQERSARPGTENVAAIVGMAKALEINHSRLEDDRQKIGELKAYLKHKLTAEVSGITFNSDSGNNDKSLFSILSVNLPRGGQNNMLIFNLDLKNIYVSAGSACASGAATKSHVLEKLGIDDTRETIRFSLSRLNTQEEIDYTVDALLAIISN